MRPSIDEYQLTQLIVESQDRHADALRGMPAAMEELTDLHHSGTLHQPSADKIARFNQGRRDFLQRLGLSALVGRGLMTGGFASALAAVVARPVFADTNLDIQILQTASSLEVLAVATYAAALMLPFIANGNAVIKTFAMTTMQQHNAHREAFQAQTGALGSAVQNNPDPKYAAVVDQAKPTLMTPSDVVKLAATLEQVATDTYLADCGMLGDTKSKGIFASIMGVECQHLATLRAVGALLDGGHPELVAIPTDVAALPAAAGSVAFPQPLEGTSMASPPSEGAVQ